MRVVYFEKKISIEDSESSGKFEEDNISFESDTYVIRTYGYFLNKSECFEHFSCNTLKELILKILEERKELPKVLHGGYLVLIYNKKKDQLHIYNDLLSKHSLFFYYDKISQLLVASDSFFETLEVVKDHNLPFNIDSLGVKMMLWHRMFYDDLTYVKEIKFLRPFEYLMLHDGEMKLEKIDSPKMQDISMDEAANEIHQRFNKAVQLQYQKNEQKNYPQIITLSGGMDSRSTFLYGLSNGYTKQSGFCYAESTSLDYSYASQLATKYDCKFFFRSLDKGNHLLNREVICKANEGQIAYSGTAGGYDSLLFYDTRKWGIVHTGHGGGEIMGDMRVAENPSKTERIIESLKYKLGKGKKDRSWDSFLRSLKCTKEEEERIKKIQQKYNDFNEFQSLNDIRRCLNGQKMAKSLGVEFVSPFLDEDFFSFMLQIPYSLTKGRKLYLYWQKKYNPKQFETPSTFQMGCKPNNKLGYYTLRFYKYITNKMGMKTKYDMIPFEQWLAINPKITQKQQEWFDLDMKKIQNKVNDDLYHLVMDSWKSNAAPRFNILTATWALEKIC